MNELLKDTINLSSIEKLDKAKDEFSSYEKEFEKIQDDFKQEDKSDLIDYLIKDINKKIMTRSITHLAIQLGIKVIAEGVETKEQLEELKNLGCNYFQGYLFAKPCPEKEL